MDDRKQTRTEITIETHRVMRIKTTASGESYCAHCREIVATILDQHAARAIGTTDKHIESLRLAGELHQIAQDRICGVSLASYVGKEKL